jgi:hypothetical protein
MQQLIRYRFADRPRRGLAVAGIFLVKGILAVPHLLIVNALGSLAGVAAYIGYWVVAITGQLPMGLQGFMAWYLRWYTRIIGWYTGVTDVYPPFEPEPSDYLPDVEPPRNETPSKGWAIAGILLPVKILAALPHLIVVALLAVAVFFGSWIGFLVVAFTGRLPVGLQDLYIGTTQWAVRVMSWIFGLTDEYPPFDLEVHPTG